MGTKGMNVPRDYTPDRAYEVYSREEFTKWLIQSRLSDPRLPAFQVHVFVARTSRRPNQRRRRGKLVTVIFVFGYEDHPHHWLGLVETKGGPGWWRELLAIVKDFYLEGRFHQG